MPISEMWFTNAAARRMKAAKAFPAIVGKLIEAGVERYHADLVRSEKTFYLPNGESETVSE